MTPEPEPEDWVAHITFTNGSGTSRRIYLSTGLHENGTNASQLTDLLPFSIGDTDNLYSYVLVDNGEVTADVVVPGGEYLYPYFSQAESTTLLSAWFDTTPARPWGDGFASGNHGLCFTPPTSSKTRSECD